MNLINLRIFFWFLFSLIFFYFSSLIGFFSSSVLNDKKKINPNSTSKLQPLPDTTFKIAWKNSSLEVHCKKAKGKYFQGTILVLPGWNHSVLRWCTEMEFCEKATAAGFQVVMPDMRKSTYTKKYFKESRQDMVDSPLLTWLTDTVILQLQKKHTAFQISGDNYVIGLSTGARGAVLVAMECPKIFKKGVAFSGDYDNSQLSYDKVMNIFYGPYSKFKDRWLAEANPAGNLKKLRTPFYFIHGKNDKVVFYSHSVNFYKMLVKSDSTLSHRLKILEGQGHTYTFWNSQVAQAIDFFSKP